MARLWVFPTCLGALCVHADIAADPSGVQRLVGFLGFFSLKPAKPGAEVSSVAGEACSLG